MENSTAVNTNGISKVVQRISTSAEVRQIVVVDFVPKKNYHEKEGQILIDIISGHMPSSKVF